MLRYLDARAVNVKRNVNFVLHVLNIILLIFAHQDTSNYVSAEKRNILMFIKKINRASP